MFRTDGNIWFKLRKKQYICYYIISNYIQQTISQILNFNTLSEKKTIWRNQFLLTPVYGMLWIRLSFNQNVGSDNIPILIS